MEDTLKELESLRATIKAYKYAGDTPGLSPDELDTELRTRQEAIERLRVEQAILKTENATLRTKLESEKEWRGREERRADHNLNKALIAEEKLADIQEKLAELKRGLRNNNTDFELAFLDAYLDNFKTLRAELSQAQQALRRTIWELKEILDFSRIENAALGEEEISSICDVIKLAEAALPSDTPGVQAQEEELCAACGKLKNDSTMHFDAPGTNWGAALHWFKAKK